ncbi:hypothetical protein HGRIS_008453 [Hohenbuehelia grisea]|uniref:Clr5 domain-containing protein n=1 Tax=Hohenbuehelia grisea TaxID=104357 RepID=A0ABR3J8F0_9AGAR
MRDTNGNFSGLDTVQANSNMSIRCYEDDDVYDHGVLDAGVFSYNSGHPKSRRVDPERLAHRLHPDLVQAMEVHIAQGSRMPTFEVRKELQERFKVDRRHIYDYFHSRGMRVAKEDKHRNLSRRRIQAHHNKKAQAPRTNSSLSISDDIQISTPALSFTSDLSTPSLGPSSDLPRPVLGSSCELPRTAKAPLCKVPKSLYSPHPRKKAIRRPSRKRKRTRSSDPYGQHLNFEDISPGVLSDLPNFELDTCTQAPSDVPEVCDIVPTDPPSDSSEIETHTEDRIEDYLDVPFHLDEDSSEALEYNLMNIELSAYEASPYPSFSAGLVVGHSFGPVSDDSDGTPPTSPKRTATYDFIDKSIGTGHGIAESVGSYRLCMQERRRLYWARLVSRPRRTSSDRVTGRISFGTHGIHSVDVHASKDIQRTCTMEAHHGGEIGHWNPLDPPHFPVLDVTQGMLAPPFQRSDDPAWTRTDEPWNKLFSYASLVSSASEAPGLTTSGDCRHHAPDVVTHDVNPSSSISLHERKESTSVTEPPKHMTNSHLNPHLITFYKNLPFFLTPATTSGTDLVGADKSTPLASSSCPALDVQANTMLQEKMAAARPRISDFNSVASCPPSDRPRNFRTKVADMRPSRPRSTSAGGGL